MQQLLQFRYLVKTNKIKKGDQKLISHKFFSHSHYKEAIQ